MTGKDGQCGHPRIRSAIFGCALVACGLVLGPGVHNAAALPGEGDQPDYDVETPVVQDVRVEGDTAYVTFVDNSARETAYQVIAWADPADETWMSDEQPFISGHGRVGTGTVSGIPSGVPLCAKVKMRIDWDDATGLMPLMSWLDSNSICSDPTTAPSDVALQNIRGNVNPQASASPAYLVELRNPGGNDAKSIVVDISTSGVAALGDQAGVLAGWRANDFTCTTNSPTSMRCTGGVLRKGEQTAPAVIVRFTGPGLGAIHAQVSGAGDNSPGNNGTALNVTAA